MSTVQKETRSTFLARLAKRAAPQADIDEIMYAYDMAKEAHRTHARDSGERYFEHVRDVSIIILDELDWYHKDLIIALLLHDTGEDSPLFGNRTAGYGEFVRIARMRIEKVFGITVADIVIRLTKPAIDGIQFHTKSEAHAFHLELIAGSDLARIGKEADRLHNLRNLGGTTPEKQKRILAETEEAYIPLFEKPMNDPFLQAKSEILTQKIKEAISVFEVA